MISTLVILLSFAGVTSPNPTYLASQYAKANTYVQAVSYGQTGLSVTMTPLLLSTEPQPCDMQTTETIGRSLATAAGYDVDAYATVVFVQGRGSCTAIGASTLKEPQFPTLQMRTWLWTDELHTILHETGHTLGLMHAGSLDCGALVNTGTACVSTDADGWLSAMSGFAYRSIGQYAAFERALLGWMVPFTVPSNLGSYTYTLRPIETVSDAIRVSRADGKDYWIEFRQPLQTDSYLSGKSYKTQIAGATVWEAKTLGTVPYYEHITSLRQLDMSPDTNSPMVMGALAASKTFDDTLNRIRIKTVSQVNGQLTVTVTRY